MSAWQEARWGEKKKKKKKEHWKKEMSAGTVEDY